MRITLAALVSIAGAASALGQALNLGALNGANGFTIPGLAGSEDFAISFARAGDINGDGVDDIVLGAGADNVSASPRGELYVVFGGAGVGASGAFDLASLDGSNGFVINGIATPDTANMTVAPAGDVNDDGADDLLLGGGSIEVNGLAFAGRSYVVFGGAGVGAGGAVSLAALDGSDGFAINGAEAYSLSGSAIASAGDLNGDGVDDIILGAGGATPGAPGYPGRSYVIFGGAGVGAAGSIELSALNGSDGFVINGVAEGDQAGVSVSSAGDVNDDGFNDVVIGALEASPGGQASAGESYVIFGGAGVGAAGSVELSTLNGSDGFVIRGQDAGDDSGCSVSDAGDVNGDGIDDVLIGARYADLTPFDTRGAAYVIFGDALIGQSGLLELGSLSGADGFAINGVDEPDACGYAVSAAGDVNGDGFGDVLIGARDAEDVPGENQAGECYVLYGGAAVGSSGTVELDALDAMSGKTLLGAAGNDRVGRTVSDAGDINNDGLADVLVGSFRAGANGAAYVVFGEQPASADLSGDGCVDSEDLAILLAAWGGPNADLDGDGNTDSADLAILLAAWGGGCA